MNINQALITKLKSIPSLSVVGDRISPSITNRDQYPRIVYDLDLEPASDTAVDDGVMTGTCTLTVYSQSSDEAVGLADAIYKACHYNAYQEWGEVPILYSLVNGINSVDCELDVANNAIYFTEVEIEIKFQN